MGLKTAWAIGLFFVSGLVSCGSDDGSKDPVGTNGGGNTATGAGGGGSSDTLPNACELFTESDAAAYGDFGPGSHFSSTQDQCIYTATIDGQVRQISLYVAPLEAFPSAVELLDGTHDEAGKSSANYGEESYLYVKGDDRASIVVKLEAHMLQVDVRLSDPEASVREISESVLTQL